MGSKRQKAMFSSLIGYWSEVVGTIEEVGESEVVMSFTRERERCVIPVRGDELRRWKNDLKVGSHVAILLLNNGTIRIRNME